MPTTTVASTPSESPSRSTSPASTLVDAPAAGHSSSADMLATPMALSSAHLSPAAPTAPARQPSHTSNSSSAPATPLSVTFPAGDPLSPSRSGSGSGDPDRSDVDSIWNEDFTEVWEQRQREHDIAEAAAATLKERTGHSKLAIGFAISPGNAMSRRPSLTSPGARGQPTSSGPGSIYTGKSGKSLPGSRVSSAAPSRALSRVVTKVGADPGKEGLEQGDLEAALDRRASRGKVWSWVDDSRRRMRRYMRLKRFHCVMIALVAFDLVIVMVELIVALLTAGCTTEQIYEVLESTIHHSDTPLTLAQFACTLAPSHSRELLETSIFGVNVFLLGLFTLDVFAALYAFGPLNYVTSWITLLDGFVVITTLCLDVYFHLSTSPSAKSPIALVILRLWKVFRAVHAIAHALEMHYQELMDTAKEGHKLLERERVSEAIRLRYVRAALIEASGKDIDPYLVEGEVERELAALEFRRKEEAARAAHEAQHAPHHWLHFQSRSKHRH